MGEAFLIPGRAREIKGGQGPAMPGLGLGSPWAVSPACIISGFESRLLPSERDGT